MSELQDAQDHALAARRKQLCEYVRNTAQRPLAVHDFDDDWTPVGEMYRDDLIEAGLIEIREPFEPGPDDPVKLDPEPGGIYLTEAGEALAS